MPWHRRGGLHNCPLPAMCSHNNVNLISPDSWLRFVPVSGMELSHQRTHRAPTRHESRLRPLGHTSLLRLVGAADTGDGCTVPKCHCLSWPVGFPGGMVTLDREALFLRGKSTCAPGTIANGKALTSIPGAGRREAKKAQRTGTPRKVAVTGKRRRSETHLRSVKHEAGTLPACGGEEANAPRQPGVCGVTAESFLERLQITWVFSETMRPV